MRLRKFAVKLGVSCVTTMLLLLFLEIDLRGYHAVRRHFGQTVPLHVVMDAPMLYGLNPAHPEINAQGLRDDAVSIPKPNGVFRILVLGDSVTYGMGVSSSSTFANRLEDLLRKQLEVRTVDVINAGVSGYTTYNELQYYLTKGRAFESDIVMLAFCMNDVANPRLHWNYTTEKIVNIPKEAIPNQAYDLHLLEALHKHKNLWAMRKYSMLYSALEWRIADIFRLMPRHADDHTSSEIATNITGEDPLSIEVLLDSSSPERQWLTAMFAQLQKATQADHATLIIVIFPLAYQLAEHYPYLPQQPIAEYCSQHSIYCIDLLDPFRGYRQEDIFFDLWHLTEYGHDLSAQEMFRFLQEQNLLSEYK